MSVGTLCPRKQTLSYALLTLNILNYYLWTEFSFTLVVYALGIIGMMVILNAAPLFCLCWKVHLELR